nr:hypothetical protein Iba_chr14eCG4520 [Ipomoea batatas]
MTIDRRVCSEESIITPYPPKHISGRKYGRGKSPDLLQVRIRQPLLLLGRGFLNFVILFIFLPSSSFASGQTSLIESNVSTIRATTVHEAMKVEPKSSASDLLKALNSELGLGPPQGTELGARAWTSLRCQAQDSTLDLPKVSSSKFGVGPPRCIWRGTSEV